MMWQYRLSSGDKCTIWWRVAVMEEAGPVWGKGVYGESLNIAVSLKPFQKNLLVIYLFLIYLFIFGHATWLVGP